MNEVLPREIWNWVCGFVETPKSAWALATARGECSDHCGYINCWVDSHRSPDCAVACGWRMYQFCRIVAEMTSKLWRYVMQHEFSIQGRSRMILFDLKMGEHLDEDSEDEVVCVGGYSGHVSFQGSDSGHSFDCRTWMETYCFANELYKALKHHTIRSDEARCTLEWFFPASPIQPLRIDVLRDEMETLLNSGPKGIFVAVEVDSTTRHMYAGHNKVVYRVERTLTDN